MERRRSQEPRLGQIPCDPRYCRNSGRTYLSQELPSHNWGRRANLLTPIVQLEVKSFGGGSNRQNKSTLQSLEPSRRLYLISRGSLNANSSVSSLPAGRRSVIHSKVAVVTQLNPSVATRMGG